MKLDDPVIFVSFSFVLPKDPSLFNFFVKLKANEPSSVPVIFTIKSIFSLKIDNVYVYGNNIRHTFNKIIPEKRGSILKDKNAIISLIKNNINNNDYLMIKGSNSTGLNRLVSNLKKGNLHAL